MYPKEAANAIQLWIAIIYSAILGMQDGQLFWITYKKRVEDGVSWMLSEIAEIKESASRQFNIAYDQLPVSKREDFSNTFLEWKIKIGEFLPRLSQIQTGLAVANKKYDKPTPTFDEVAFMNLDDIMNILNDYSEGEKEILMFKTTLNGLLAELYEHEKVLNEEFDKIFKTIFAEL